MKQADAGLKLFKTQEETKCDVQAAEAHKAKVDADIAALEAEVEKLTGKDNKKERTAKSKQISEMKNQPQYIDACKVAKGLEPKNGFFVVKSESAPAPAAEAAALAAEAAPEAKKEAKKDDKKSAKKHESAGISPAERQELEKLKQDLIDRKAQLKAEGMSGGQCNKDAQVVQWVARMNELKEKAEPGSTKKDDKADKQKKSKASLSSEELKQVETLEAEIESYKHKLRTEFGYNNKDIKADPELMEKEALLASLNKRNK